MFYPHFLDWCIAKKLLVYTLFIFILEYEACYGFIWWISLLSLMIIIIIKLRRRDQTQRPNGNNFSIQPESDYLWHLTQLWIIFQSIILISWMIDIPQLAMSLMHWIQHTGVIWNNTLTMVMFPNSLVNTDVNIVHLLLLSLLNFI